MSGYVKLVLTAVFWAGAFFTGKYSVMHAPPIAAAFLRFLIAGILLIALLFYYRAWPDLKIKGLFLRYIWLAFTGIFLYNAFFFSGLHGTSTINGSLLAGANPGITALINRLYYKEKLGARRWAGIVLSFSGVALVVTGGSFEKLISLKINPSDLLILFAVVCWAVYTVSGKSAIALSSAVAATAFACSIGALMLFFPAAYQASSSDLIWVRDWIFWASILYMSIFASALAYIWWYQGVRQIGSSRSAIFINLVPVGVMLMSSFSGIVPDSVQITGAVFILAGVFLTASNGKSSTAQAIRNRN